MRTFALLFLGVVVGCAASCVDWSRKAVGENIQAAGESPTVEYYRALTRVQIEELGGRKDVDGIVGADDLKFLNAGLNALAAENWVLVTIEQAHQYTAAGPAGANITNPATYLFEHH